MLSKEDELDLLSDEDGDNKRNETPIKGSMISNSLD
jgi:hypothetical protein